MVEGPEAPEEREALVAWLADSTWELLEALTEAGPDRECWVGWTRSQSPRTTGAVARHQVQEIAVHTYDAQLAIGTSSDLVLTFYGRNDLGALTLLGNRNVLHQLIAWEPR